MPAWLTRTAAFTMRGVSFTSHARACTGLPTRTAACNRHSNEVVKPNLPVLAMTGKAAGSSAGVETQPAVHDARGPLVSLARSEVRHHPGAIALELQVKAKRVRGAATEALVVFEQGAIERLDWRADHFAPKVPAAVPA